MSIEVENANLKSQLAANQQGIHNLISQLEAHQGELADSRAISLQLRTKLILFQKSNNELIEKIKLLETQLAKTEVPPKGK